MKLGTKIIVAALGAIGLTAGVTLLVQRSVIQDQGVELTKAAMRGAVIEAENVRASISALNEAHAFDSEKLLAEAKVAKDLRQTSIYGTIPVVAAWNSIAKLAEQEGFHFRVPKFNPRNPENEPTPEEAKILKRFETENLEDYFEADDGTGKMVYARPIRLTNDCLACHGDPATSPTKDGRDILGFPMENWKAGEVHGAFILKADRERVDRVVAAGVKKSAAWVLPLALLLGIGFYFLSRRMIVVPLTRAMAGLRAGADQVNAAAGQVSSSAQLAAANASTQASTVSSADAAVTSLATATTTNATDAHRADQLATRAKSQADKGNETVAQLTEVMTGVNQSATEVCKIIKVIEDIAFQTNLLALNAAVEAARAGEHGKGFAVVAEEVRALAQRSAKAAGQTNELISVSVERAKQGALVSQGVRQVLGEIGKDIHEIAGVLQSISSAGGKQTADVNQIQGAVTELDRISQENAAGAEETAAAAEELTAMAVSLKDQLLGDLVSVIEGNRRRERRQMYVDSAEVITDIGSQPVSVMTTNISRSGLGIRAKQSIDAGSTVNVKLQSPQGEVAVPAQVVRCTPTGDDFELGLAMQKQVDPDDFRSQVALNKKIKEKLAARK